MAMRVYLVPVIGLGSSTVNDPRRPQYIDGGAVAGYQAMDYGLEPVMLVAADVTTPEHAAVVAHPEVTVFPANLNATVGANLAAVQAALEGHNLPSGWVTSGMTYRTVAKALSQLFMVQQRVHGVGGGRLFLAGLTLNSTVGDLSVAKRGKLQAAADSFGVDSSGVTLATTLRAVLKLFADQVSGAQSIGGVAL